MYKRVKRVVIRLIICAIAISLCFSSTLIVLAADATVDLTATKQIIRGFGGSSAWRGAISDTNMDVLYDTMGLSILRVRISYSKSWSDELSNAQKAKARGAIVFATPWTPPASMKDNNNIVNGSLKTTEYANYANYLREFCDYMDGNAASLYAISVQNEPDFEPTYESCTWTGEQIRDFLKANRSLIGPTKVIAPESYNFDNASMADPILNDSTAASNVDIIGGHLYGVTPKAYPLAKTKGKELWMTEYLVNDQSLSSALDTAKEINDCMTVANMNAYVWFYLMSDANGLLNMSSVPQKRGYVMGQFAKFVRPGYTRIDATSNPNTDIYVSAYKNAGKLVIVAINKGTASLSQKFVLQNGTVSSMSRWRTSASEDLASTTGITVSDGSFWAYLPAQSISTFVGDLGTSSGTTYQAESATLTSSSVETACPGYSGTGYVNFGASSGAAIQWDNVPCSTTGLKNLKFKYALESGTRNLDIYINGTKVITNAVFPSTGSWSTWAEKTFLVNMSSGTNTVKVVTTGTEGPNIDYLNALSADW